VERPVPSRWLSAAVRQQDQLERDKQLGARALHESGGETPPAVALGCGRATVWGRRNGDGLTP
jgi:hypothetical protein